jgi:hypothetical protein
MGGTACHYSSFDSQYNGCTSSPSDSVLSAGAIVGIVIGSLVGIAVIIVLVVISCRLTRRNNPPSNQQHPMNVYRLPTNIDDHHQPPRRPEMYPPYKSPMYSDAPMYNNHYNNA